VPRRLPAPKRAAEWRRPTDSRSGGRRAVADRAWPDTHQPGYLSLGLIKVEAEYEHLALAVGKPADGPHDCALLLDGEHRGLG
jgi:hypothetical protein